MFSWIDFLEANRIDYRTSGPNVSRGNVVIHCPFCGPADHGEHLSLAVEGVGWRCLRNPNDHRGKSPIRLIRALIGCSAEQAARIAGVRTPPKNILDTVRRRLLPEEAHEDARVLTLPKEFRPLKPSPRAAPYLGYLKRRGITCDPMTLTSRYGMYYAPYGRFGGRIIFTVYHEGKLVSWTGRSISKNNDLRYLTLGDKEDDDPRALGPISDYLLWYNDCMTTDAHTLCVCEGPFDALKVRLLGEPHGIMATCLFTLAASDAQRALLYDILPRFENQYLLLDQTAFAASLKLRSKIAPMNVETRRLPDGVKDPGELTHIEFLLRRPYHG